MPPLGDPRPSHMMNKMLAHIPTGSNKDDYIFLGIFLRKLPSSMREHLAAANHTTAATMSAHHDILWDAKAGDTNITSISDASVSAVANRSFARRSLDRRRGRSGAKTQTNTRSRFAPPWPFRTKTQIETQSRFAPTRCLHSLFLPQPIWTESKQMRAAVFLDGKLGRCRGQVNAGGSLVYLQDDKSKQKFLAPPPVCYHTSSLPPPQVPFLPAQMAKPFRPGAVCLALSLSECAHSCANSFSQLCQSQFSAQTFFQSTDSSLIPPLVRFWMLPHSPQLAPTTPPSLPDRTDPHWQHRFATSLRLPAPSFRTFLPHRRWIRHPKANPRGHPLH